MKRRQHWLVRGLLLRGLLVMSTMLLWNPMLHADTPDLKVSEFVLGHYDMIGRDPDSKRTYAGEIEIRAGSGGPGSLVVLRRIGGQVVRATGKIETATADEALVLRLHFMIRNVPYEGTYLINGDLDNYPRISGFVYRRDGRTKAPGLEALFHLESSDSDSLEPGKVGERRIGDHRARIAGPRASH